MPGTQLERLQRREIPPPRLADGLRSLPAWMVSLLFHICVLVMLGFIWTARPKGTGAESDRPLGVAVVYNASGTDEYLLSSGSASDSAASSNAPSTAESAAGLLPAGGDLLTSASRELLADLLPGETSAGGNTERAAGGVGLSEGGAALGGTRDVPKVKTTVFGIEGEGTRFLYVFDRSASMNGYGGAPIKAAKAELAASIQSLGDVHQFQIVFYNESPLAYGGNSSRGPRLLRGDEATKVAALRFVRDVVADGGTRHVDALRMALAMGPDVIFFLTDADSSPSNSELDDLRNRAARGGTTVHTIQFGSGPSSSQNALGWIERLAADTGGQNRYIDVTQL